MSLKRAKNSRKSVKHAQTIRRQFEFCLSVFDHFVGLKLEGLREAIMKTS